MDFKGILVNFLSSLVIVIVRVFNLVFVPYKTMRKISMEKDLMQPLIIFFLVFAYFQFGYQVRPFEYRPLLIFLIFLVNFFLSILTLSLLTNSCKKERLLSFILTFSYSLIPTLIWFLTSSVLYFFLPPPRTMSLLGKGFSIFYLTFSVSILAWKIILTYLAVRFSSRQSFYKVIFSLIIYVAVSFPYFIFLYYLRIFRVPFI